MTPRARSSSSRELAKARSGCIARGHTAAAHLCVAALALVLGFACGETEDELEPERDSGAVPSTPGQRDGGDPSSDAQVGFDAGVQPGDGADDADASPDVSGDDASTATDASAPSDTACPVELLGWAAVSGDGVSSTTGGGDAAPIRVRNAEELVGYASDDTPRVLEIEGTLDVPRLQVGSNKTLVGVGSGATIRGGIRVRGRADEPVQNVILRNLSIDGKTTEVDNDAVRIYFAHHVWIDHCEIWDGPDGNLDMTHAVDWVTVSWTKFRYTREYKRPSGESSDHRFSSLLGHSDGNAREDEGRLKVTFHHNYWGERVIERMPRVRFGQVHVYNNYFHAPGNNYCVRAGRGARLLIEANYFHNVKDPHVFNSTADEATAHITARDNMYEMSPGERAAGGGGAAFTSVPYDPKADPAAEVPALVQRCVGPR